MDLRYVNLLLITLLKQLAKLKRRKYVFIKREGSHVTHRSAASSLDAAARLRRLSFRRIFCREAAQMKRI